MPWSQESTKSSLLETVWNRINAVKNASNKISPVLKFVMRIERTTGLMEK